MRAGKRVETERKGQNIRVVLYHGVEQAVEDVARHAEAAAECCVVVRRISAEVLPVQYIAEFAAVTVDVRRAARAGAAARHLLIVTFADAVEQGEHDVVRSGRRGVGEEAHVVRAMEEHDYSGSHDWHAGTSFQHWIWHLPWYRWVRIT